MTSSDAETDSKPIIIIIIYCTAAKPKCPGRFCGLFERR